ncbi:unnamed protein product [Prunus armeniaca]
MNGEIEVRDASNESLVVFSTSVPNATDNFGGMPPKLCTFFGWISPVRNLIFGGDPPNLLPTTNLIQAILILLPLKEQNIQAILILLPLKEQNQGDAPTEGNNVGIECPRENQSAFDTYMHIEKFPKGIRKYITHQTEVLPDGNCGYRAIAMAMRFGHNEWRRVRKDLLQQLHDMSFVFKKCIREHKRYNEIERALNYFDDGFAPFFCWMTMPDMGHIIATRYNVVLILLSMRQCLTFLPFSVQSSETKLNEIAIGFVDDDHYVQVHLSPDHPIPPVSRMWHEQSDICNVTHLYSRYQARVDAFQQLPGVENVATTDTVILMTDENAPVT